ncbi:MAG: T9SS type A sorting domain-containing protein [Bacteroidetes bacterium]|nr:T9SS type A sorting domain-containing protein [Bacteroidota bacterium]
MKYSYPNRAIGAIFSAMFLLIAATGTINAQSNSELVFRKPTVDSGNGGNDGAIYRFASVQTGVDALVKITGRSSSLVKLENIDLDNTGWDKAFQPQVSYNNGKTKTAADWWMEFKITFVKAGTKTAADVTSLNVTGLDIDGDNNNLTEYLSFYKQSSYALEKNSKLTVTSILDNLLGSVLDLLTPTSGKKFMGTKTEYGGVDTTQTQLMVTNTYNNVNSFTVRTGAKSTGSADDTRRMYSMYFKSFTYNSAVVASLPVKLINWNATYADNNVKLSWATTQEINASHFIIERSANGTDYTDAALIFANGNSEIQVDYSYNDKVPGTNSGILYYRLRSVDLDGKSTVSDVRIIRLGAANASAVKIVTYPNPVQSEVRITIPASWQDKAVVYQVLNTNGQAVKTVTTSHAGQTEVIPMGQVPQGMYIVRVICGNETGVQSVVKQ